MRKEELDYNADDVALIGEREIAGGVFEITGGIGRWIEVNLDGKGEAHTDFQCTNIKRDEYGIIILEFTEMLDKYIVV